jgi:Sulfatase
MGDDVGMWNIGAYHRGMMAGKTPNLDKLAKEGMLFTDYYAEASCTAGRANFITGELPIRTSMTTVGQAGASVGLPATVRSGRVCATFAPGCRQIYRSGSSTDFFRLSGRAWGSGCSLRGQSLSRHRAKMQMHTRTSKGEIGVG